MLPGPSDLHPASRISRMIVQNVRKLFPRNASEATLSSCALPSKCTLTDFNRPNQAIASSHPEAHGGTSLSYVPSLHRNVDRVPRLHFSRPSCHDSSPCFVAQRTGWDGMSKLALRLRAADQSTFCTIIVSLVGLRSPSTSVARIGEAISELRHSAPGTSQRRPGTQKLRHGCGMGPGSAAHHAANGGALHCVRGTPPSSPRIRLVQIRNHDLPHPHHGLHHAVRPGAVGVAEIAGKR